MPEPSVHLFQYRATTPGDRTDQQGDTARRRSGDRLSREPPGKNKRVQGMVRAAADLPKDCGLVNANEPVICS